MVGPNSNYANYISLVPVQVDGQTFQANLEQTSTAFANQFWDNIGVFAQIFNLQDQSGSGGPTIAEQITPAMVQSAQNAMTNLLSLAQNGLVSPVSNTSIPATSSTPGPYKTYFMSVQMSTYFDLLVKTLKAAGNADPLNNPSTMTEEGLQLWRSIAAQTQTIQQVMASIEASSTYANKGLQSLTELIYVNTGNEVMEESLSSLQSALTTTKTSLDTLTDLTNLKNEVTITNKPPFTDFMSYNPAVPNNDYAAFSRAYQQIASYYFGTPIVPELAGNLVDTVQVGWLEINAGADGNFTYKLSAGDLQNTFGSLITLPVPAGNNNLPVFSVQPGAGFADALYQLLNDKAALSAQIAQLSVLTPATGGSQDSASLYARLKQVLSDINANLYYLSGSTKVQVTFSTPQGGDAWNQAFLGFRNWMLDNTQQKFNLQDGGDPSKAGLYSRNLTFAVSAGESLNDTQKEQVRNYLFVFQEYYQSASAILKALSDMITKMAQGIAR